jgi:biotin carboxylase
VGVDEVTVVAAAAAAAALGLPHNPMEAVRAAGNKALMRAMLSRAGVPCPRHWLFRLEEGSAAAARRVWYPCVLKPTFLGASRGVIRADGPEGFAAAWSRISRILSEPEVARRGAGAAGEILVEEFVPGVEVALEGILTEGRLAVLALFDKPDALDGPFFEETIYVTPSRLPAGAQAAIARAASDGARALGLTGGPVHAELRWNDAGASLIEIAARSIGGLCARTLRFGTGVSLEELVLSHALGMDAAGLERDSRAAAVLMIPIPRAGVLEQVSGLAQARQVPGIEDIAISAHPGQRLVPLPEGSRYLGFVFARAETPEQAEAALREAHGRLVFRIRS